MSAWSKLEAQAKEYGYTFKVIQKEYITELWIDSELFGIYWRIDNNGEWRYSEKWFNSTVRAFRQWHKYGDIF